MWHLRARRPDGDLVARSTKPTSADLAVRPIRIDSHRSLLARRKTLIAALVEDPERGRLLFANAALAFKDAGVELSPAVADHVLHTVRQSAAATTQRERLTTLLRRRLRVVPHPSDPAWLATTLFTRLNVTPLVTKGHTPTYQPVIPTDALERMRSRLPRPSRPRVPARAVTPTTEALWRIDLDAEVPVLRTTTRVPTRVTLEELWFYLPRHELVRPLLELGVLEWSVLPTLTPAQFRAVQAGKPTGGFIDWVDTVTFPTDRVARRAPP